MRRIGGGLANLSAARQARLLLKEQPVCIWRFHHALSTFCPYRTRCGVKSNFQKASSRVSRSLTKDSLAAPSAISAISHGQQTLPKPLQFR